MEKQAKKTFKTALRAIRREQKVSLQELGLRIDSDASHVFKIEHGQDVSLSTVLRLADALGVSLQFGAFKIVLDASMKLRTRKRK